MRTIQVIPTHFECVLQLSIYKNHRWPRHWQNTYHKWKKGQIQGFRIFLFFF